MTEDEAKTKWCFMVKSMPHIMFSDGPDGDATKRRINAAEDEQRKYRCIGSDCMAWRWINETAETGIGYCGMAGK